MTHPGSGVELVGTMKAVRAFYGIFTHTVILFLLIVTGTHVALSWYLRNKDATALSRLSEVARRNYAHLSEPDAAELLRNTVAIRYRFAPWVGMRERPTTSRFVNVDEYGIRSNGRPIGTIAALQDAIWFFGGSTTFGYGVADHESIPARLEATLGRPVVNFGAAAFFSAQENLRLVQVLRYGYRPSRVIFLDGINESCRVVDDERADSRFEDLLDAYRWQPLEIVRPVAYVARKLRDRARAFMGEAPPVDPDDNLICAGPEGPRPLTVVHARMLAERESLCRVYALECTTFVQPFPGLHGRHEDYRELPQAERDWYRDKFTMLEGNWRAAHATFVTDALDRHPAHAFVDSAHYSQAASLRIAEAIAGHLHGASLARTPATTDGPRAVAPARSPLPWYTAEP